MDRPSDDKQLNALERAVLQWFIENYKDDSLTAQISAARLKERKWTKVGFYIELDVPHNLSLLDSSKIIDQKTTLRKGEKVNAIWPIDGPFLKSADIDAEGGVLLWGKDGYITTIEVYANGAFFNENVREFTFL